MGICPVDTEILKHSQTIAGVLGATLHYMSRLSCGRCSTRSLYSERHGLSAWAEGSVRGLHRAD